MKYLYVCLFAFIGGVLRYALTLLSGDFSILATLTANVTGSYLLGLLSGYPFDNQHLKTGLTSGMIGSFTTFSTFTAESVSLLRHDISMGILYMTLTIGLGLSFSYLGMRTGGRFFC